jgi:hypothetical protein
MEHQASTRDSAGISIVVDAPPTPEDNPAWAVDPDPILTIGRLDGSEEYFLEAIQAATLLGDQTTAVQNSRGGLFEVRYYDAQGKHLRTVSRWGDGPFEFRLGFGFFHLSGDSVFVLGLDFRMAVFGPNGDEIREDRLGISPSGSFTSSALIDPGHLALVQHLSAPPSDGQQRPKSRYLIHSLVDGVTTPVVELDGIIQFQRWRYPFSPVPYHAAGVGRLWTGQSDHPEIKGFDATGRLVTIIRLDRLPRDVKPRDRDRWMEQAVASADSPDGKRETRAAFRRMEYPESMPFFGRFEIDRTGNLWVSRYEPPWKTGSQYWDVYDQQGMRIASAKIPEEIVPACARKTRYECDYILEIGGDYVLVRQEDSLGVQSLVRYHLSKQGRG